MTEATPTLPFEAPNDPEVSIWRYMDFAKFVAMLESESLWFSRMDCLGDPFEGSTPKAELDYWESLRNENPEKKDVADHNEDMFRTMAGYSRQNTYVNCWHINEHESDAMWQLYSKVEASIAVRSSFALFREVLPAEVDLGIVKYIDYETEKVPLGNIISYCMHKRKSFEHERELRALIWGLGVNAKTREPKWPVETGASGIEVAVDLTGLISEIVLAPSSPKWFEQLVRSVVKRYGHCFCVYRSRMEREPLL